jgi:hypothetical protein
MMPKSDELRPLFATANPFGDSYTLAVQEALAMATGPHSLKAAADRLCPAIMTPLAPVFGTAEVLDTIIRQQEMLSREYLA